MKLKFVWGVPTLVLPSWDDLGHTVFNLMFIPTHKQDDKALIAHELWHVRQALALFLPALTVGLYFTEWYYAMFAAFVLQQLAFKTPELKKRMEFAAYAESVRNGGDMTQYVKFIVNHPKYGVDNRAEARYEIQKRLNSSRLF